MSPVLASVSSATRELGSSVRSASRTASEIWSHILSGWPSETDSEVNRKSLSGIIRDAPWSAFSGKIRIQLMQAARATEAFNCVQFQWVEYSACARVKREKSAALLKIFGIEGITDQSDRIKVVAQTP